MRTACAATANATASAVPIPLAIRMAAPAPAWVAAPAGAIGSAAEAAEAQRNASAIGRLEALVPTESACSSTKSAAPRKSQEMETSAQAFEASRGEAQCSRTQLAGRK